MRQPRGTLAVALLLAGASIAGAAAWLVLPGGPPDPRTADRDGLLRWIVTRDLSRESPETRRVLAVRLDEEFAGGIDWEATSQRLDDSQKERLWDNVRVLIQPWLAAKVDGYFVRPEAERETYVDEVIDRLQTWRGAEGLRPPAEEVVGASVDEAGLLEVLTEEIEGLKGRAEPARREQIAEFQLALQSRWLDRTVPGLRGLLQWDGPF